MLRQYKDLPQYNKNMAKKATIMMILAIWNLTL
jgi:hypothetical protein